MRPMPLEPDNPHYRAIQDFYGQRRAKRSGVKYMRHIDEALLLLDAMEASRHAMEGFCLHPIVQSDTSIEVAFGSSGLLKKYAVDARSLALAIEYRWVANGYRSTMAAPERATITLSPLLEVRQMLIADKVQNRKDFELHHERKHPRARELSRYFARWLEALGVTEQDYQQLRELLPPG